jgi:PAS domain S-box-containing protein
MAQDRQIDVQGSPSLDGVDDLYPLLSGSLSDHAVFLLDAAGRVVSWNPGAERMLGYSGQAIVDQPAAIFFPSEDRTDGDAEQDLKVAAETGQASRERWQVREDGVRLWARITTTALHDLQGSLRGFARIVQTRPAPGKQVVQQGAQRRDQPFPSSTTSPIPPSGDPEAGPRVNPGPGWLPSLARIARTVQALQDVDTILRLLTEEARQLIGAHQAITSRTRNDAWAQSIVAVSLSENHSHRSSHDERPIAAGLSLIVCRTNRSLRLTPAELKAHPEYSLRGPEAGRQPPLSGWMAAPLVGRDGRNLGLIQLLGKQEGEFTEQDESLLLVLTQMASAVIENGRLSKKIREADRAKDKWLSMLAHELRNPLAPMTNALHLLGMAGVDSELISQARGVLGRQLRHMTHMIEHLLDVTRLTRGKVELLRERLDLKELVRNTAEDYRRALVARGLSLVITVPPTPVWVWGDPTRLAQVLGNLLDNAARFTAREGTVFVQLTPAAAPAVAETRPSEDSGSGLARAPAGCAEPKQAVLTVRDSGAGIEPEMIPGLFDVFAQADRSLNRSQGGLGLGLAVVKGLTELHEGTVEAASAGRGQGATFTVRLPVLAEPAALTRVPKASGAHGPTLRVLIIEDNHDGADSLGRLLRRMGHDVRVTYTGTEGVHEALNWRPQVVISDIGLPGMNGYDVARELRKAPATASARLIALTGYGTELDRRRALESGFDVHVTKPADPEFLLSLLARKPNHD